eukprot:s2_g43.t1
MNTRNSSSQICGLLILNNFDLYPVEFDNIQSIKSSFGPMPEPKNAQMHPGHGQPKEWPGAPELPQNGSTSTIGYHNHTTIKQTLSLKEVGSISILVLDYLSAEPKPVQ